MIGFASKLLDKKQQTLLFNQNAGNLKLPLRLTLLTYIPVGKV